MGNCAIVTVVTHNYLHYAHALALSVKERCPDASFFVCLVDHPGDDFRAPESWTGWISIEELGIPDVRRFAFQYAPFALSCALKPHAMRKLFELGYERVVYLDSDMQVYGPLDELHRWLDDSSLVLTPHAISPAQRVPGLDERVYLRAGVFNAGFLAARRTPTTDQFLAWWSERVRKLCIDDQLAGFFVDQKWLDLVPGLFSDIHISRHFGYNAGHWTLTQVSAAADRSGQIRLGPDPLVVWHFSGFQLRHPEIISRYSADCDTKTFPDLRPMAHSYAARLIQCGADYYQTLPCELTRLSDGTPIRPAWREAIRNEHPALANVSDPFDAAQTPNLALLFQQSEGAIESPGSQASPPEKNPLKRWGKDLERFVRGVRDQTKARWLKSSRPDMGDGREAA